MSPKHPHTYTIQMVETLIAFVPPLVPSETVASVRDVLARSRRGEATLAELEEAAVDYGLRTWAHRQAFGKLLDSYRELFFEKLLTQKASPSLKKAYRLFKTSGGGWQELYRGALAGILEPEARAELNHLLVDITMEIKKFAAQALSSTEREKYEAEISGFQESLRGMIRILEDLKILARDPDHATVAGEIREFIKSFRHGLAQLEVKISFDALKRAREHFRGRKIGTGK